MKMMKANMVSAEKLSIEDFIHVESARQIHCSNRPDFAARMAESPDMQRWWDICMPLQQPLETRRPGEWWAGMAEVFYAA